MEGRDYFTLDLRTPSGLRSEHLETFLQGTPMAGLGKAFIDVEARHGVNARYLCAHAVLESGWGRSKIAREKNNLFGFGAYDRNPYQHAMFFTSPAESIEVVAAYIARHYLDPAGKYYHGPTLRGMNRKYATDPRWAEKIAQLMSQIPEPALIPPEATGATGPGESHRMATEATRFESSLVAGEKQEMVETNASGRLPNPRTRKLFHLFGLKRR